MKKFIKILAGSLAVLIMLYFSLDIRKLDKKNASSGIAAFSAENYANDFWENKLADCMEKAINIIELKQLLKDNPQEAFDKYSHRLGISKTHFFYIKGNGKVEAVTGEQIVVTLGENTKAGLTTLYIFGNAIRDGSGLVDINTFLNMMDFNKVSVYLNKRVKKEVVVPVLTKVHAGMAVEFTGAVEISIKEYNPDFWSVIPLRITLGNGE